MIFSASRHAGYVRNPAWGSRRWPWRWWVRSSWRLLLLDTANELPLEIADQHGQAIVAGVVGSQAADGLDCQLAMEGFGEAEGGQAFGGKAGGFGSADFLDQVGRGADFAGRVGQDVAVHLGLPGVGDGQPLAHLGQLADHGADRDVRHAALDGAGEGGLDEVAHLHEAGFIEIRQLAHGEFLGAPASGEDQVVLPLIDRHIHRLHDAGAEGSRRVGANDAGGAEDGNAAQDTEPGVQRLFRHLVAAGHGDGDFQTVVFEQFATYGAHVVDDVAARHRVDRRPANLQAQPGLGDQADARPAFEHDLAGAVWQQAHVGRQVGAVRGIRIVAGILDDDGMGQPGAFLDAAIAYGEAHLLTIGQAADDACRHLAEQQAERCRPGCGRRTGAGGEARAVAAFAAGVALSNLGRGLARVFGCVHAAFFCSASASDSMAWMAATTNVEPPLRPLMATHGTSFTVISRSFDSAAETKPTGIPMTRAGRTPSSRIRRTSSIRAVGALPMPTMAPSSLPRRCALRMACTARALLAALAISITSASEM